MGILSQCTHISNCHNVYYKIMIFPVVIYGCESWTIKKAECQIIDAFELWCQRTLENILDNNKVKPVNHKGNQHWMFTGRTDAEAGAPILWPPDVKSQLIRKDSDAGKDWEQEKWATEDEMFGWHHWLNGQSLSKLQEMVKDKEAWHAVGSWVVESDTT